MVKYYLVPEEDLADLMTDSLCLQALENGGVDDWEGYGWSIGEFLNMCREDYNIPEGTEFSISDLAETDMQGYKSVEVTG